MPLFDLVCTKCGHEEADILVPYMQVQSLRCPKCQSELKKKEIQSGGNFHLKGNGWYVTDYKGKN